MGAYEFKVGTDASLPVELTVFEAQCRGGAVVLSWTTESETDNLGFLIQRKTAGDWETIADYKSVDGLRGQGSTTQRTEYCYTDAAVMPGESYSYRLGDVDYDGTVTLHQSVTVAVAADETDTRADRFRLHAAYPNPFNPAVTLAYDLTDAGHTSLQVYNVRGQVVATLVDEYQPANSYTLTWQPVKLSAGIYLVRLESIGQVNVQKIVFVK